MIIRTYTLGDKNIDQRIVEDIIRWGENAYDFYGTLDEIIGSNNIIDGETVYEITMDVKPVGKVSVKKTVERTIINE